MLRPGYIFDNHKRLVDKLFDIMDRAAVEYDADEDVVDDFTQYVKDWANRRSEAILERPNGI
jgi:hypothetical protein